MSDEEIETVDDTCCCASCGIIEIDDIKFMECDGCDLVRYCSDECRENHSSEHKEVCKKRAAELRDELLFKQPESTHMGDCPICSLPQPLDTKKSVVLLCCSKLICDGCLLANAKREIQGRLQQLCPFCRTPMAKTREGIAKQLMKRVDANDPVAMCKEGMEQFGKGDYSRAFEYWAKSAKLGNAEAHYHLSHLYTEGLGVEEDEGKIIHHLEEAAIGGHPTARQNLGAWEVTDDIERAVKHWTIAATQGYDSSIKALTTMFKRGFVSKEDLAVALRAHKAAVDATKSPQRKEAEKVYQK